eukprot:SAG25_NODE_507_length_7316_cov_2.334904_4_plen_53_part_00
MCLDAWTLDARTCEPNSELPRPSGSSDRSTDDTVIGRLQISPAGTESRSRLP